MGEELVAARTPLTAARARTLRAPLDNMVGSTEAWGKHCLPQKNECRERLLPSA